MSGFGVVPSSRRGRAAGCWCSCLAVVLAGCSAGSSGPQSRFSSVPAQPELPAVNPDSPLRYRRLVPTVIAAPRPFRVEMLDEVPGPLPLVTGSIPTAAPAVDGPAIRLTGGGATTAEPRPLPVISEPSRPAVAAIGAMFTTYREAFNRHDAEAAAAHWTAGGENLDLDSGERTAGREAVRGIFAALFEIDPRAAMEIDIGSIRPLRDDVAVVDGISQVAYEDGSVAGSRFSAVVVREQERWLLANVREAAAPVEPRTAGPLDELAWLVGSWENLGAGLTASSDCFWAPGRRFLVRSHVVTPDAAAATPPPAGDTEIPGLLPPPVSERQQLTEMIGWDPERQVIRAWLFAADGRFAEATWSRSETGWLVRIDGQGGDAGRTATLSLEPDGTDGFTLRCEGEGLEGLCPPASSFSRTAR